jgi:hypothetical protein
LVCNSIIANHYLIQITVPTLLGLPQDNKLDRDIVCIRCRFMIILNCPQKLNRQGTSMDRQSFGGKRFGGTKVIANGLFVQGNCGDMEDLGAVALSCQSTCTLSSLKDSSHERDLPPWSKINLPRAPWPLPISQMGQTICSALQER